MFARAFESYIYDRIMTSGQSDYLVHSAVNESYDEEINPYPADEERTDISKAFDKLFKTIKTEETDSGIRMYSRMPQKINPQDDTLSNRPETIEKVAPEILQYLAPDLRAQLSVSIAHNYKWTDPNGVVHEDRLTDEQEAAIFRDREDGGYKLIINPDLDIHRLHKVFAHDVLGHFGLKDVI